MTSVKDRITQQIHHWIKPTTRWAAGLISTYTNELATEKDKSGWDLPEINQIRRIYKKFIETPLEVENVTVPISNDREFIKPFLDLVCLHLESEGVLSSARIKLLIKLAREEGFI